MVNRFLSSASVLPTDAPTLVFPSSRVLVFSRAQSQRAGFIIFCVGFLVDVLAKGAIFSMHAENSNPGSAVSLGGDPDI